MGCSQSSSKRKFIAINAHLRKQTKKKKCQISHLILHLKKLEKEQMKPKVSRRKEIKIRVEINETETKKTRAGSLKR